jgi:hypothetical protein
MKTFFLLLISIIILYGNIYAQQTGWSTVTRLTNSKTKDRHPSMPQRLWEYRELRCPLVLAFDRTDSLGTNICLMEAGSAGWTPEIHYITNGQEINEYPSVSDKMVVFQKRGNNCSNIYYSMKTDSGWSEVLPFTNDTNNYNLHPRIFYDVASDPNIWVVWEKDKMIFYKMYDGIKWQDEMKVTPDDTFAYSHPVITYYNIAFEKNIDNDNQYIYNAYPSGNSFIIRPVDTIGYNKNPEFINGYKDYLTWEKKENNKWKIYEGADVGSFWPRSIITLGIGDDLYNYNKFAGIAVNIPILQNIAKNASNMKINSFRTLACLCIRSQDSTNVIIGGTMQPEQIIFKDKADNPTISQKYLGGDKHKVWAVWESEKDGYTNLYGSSYDIYPTSIENKKEYPEYELYQNFPNPFNPSTVISYSVVGTQKFAFVQLKVYDILGREVKTLVNEYKAPGKYNVTFDGKDLSSGVYFCRLMVKDKNCITSTIKQIPMMMVK